jgi:D-lactate dehydrogenase (cytochrome)
MKKELIKILGNEYEEYLSDESKMKGYADTISFPKTKDEIERIVMQMKASGISITVQGGKTGICGAAVPLGGHVMNLSFMTGVESLRKTKDGYLLKVQPGVLLCELRSMLSLRSFDTTGWDEDSLKTLKEFKTDSAYFWPPDPTETSAAIGGMIGTNAQSITDFRYGRLKEYVEEIELVDSHGNLLITKDTARYLGSEGMYGIFTAATLRLIRKPQEMWGICFFFEDETSLLQFAEGTLTIQKEGSSSIAAVEYIGRQALVYVQRLRETSSKLQELPDIDSKYTGIIYVELHGNEAAEIEQLMIRLLDLAAKYGNDGSSTWALSGDAGIEKIKLLRHSVPESVNLEIKKRSSIDSRITKLSTDLTTSNNLPDDIRFYQEEVARLGLEAVIFGHVPENRIHVNIISNSFEDYTAGKMLLEAWYRRALASGGTVFREHGVGKVKRDLFCKVMDQGILEKLIAEKKALDPQGLLNPGNKTE